jgi:hypothetical protein
VSHPELDRAPVDAALGGGAESGPLVTWAIRVLEREIARRLPDRRAEHRKYRTARLVAWRLWRQNVLRD